MLKVMLKGMVSQAKKEKKKNQSPLVSVVSTHLTGKAVYHKDLLLLYSVVEGPRF